MQSRTLFALPGAMSVLLLSSLAGAGSVLLDSVAQAQEATGAVQFATGDSEQIQTLDHFVPHTSTVPANEGEPVELFVRERVGRGHHHPNRPVVLMVAGAATPAMEGFDLRFENYSWMGFLAEAGFDVFAMDFTGYGFSPRPMMDDPCNTTRMEQERFLIPNPLPMPCDPSYPFTLSNMQSDWDEMDTVVDYLRRLRGVDTVNLVGWSRAGVRIGGYTARQRLLTACPLRRSASSSCSWCCSTIGARSSTST